MVDGCVGTDVGVLDPRFLPDAGRSSHDAVFHLGSALHGDLPADLGSLVDASLDLGLEGLEDQPIGLQEIFALAGVDPPSIVDVGMNAILFIEQVLDGVGDLELSPPGRLDRLDRLEDMVIEHIDPHQGKVAGRTFWLLHQSDQPAVVELRDAVPFGMRHPLQDDLTVPV